MKVSLINSSPTNNEIYDTTDVSSLANSIKENGLLEPLVITREGNLLSGHRRLEAIKNLGWEDVDVRIVDVENEVIALIEHNRYRTKSEKDVLRESRFLEKELRSQIGKGRNAAKDRGGKKLSLSLELSKATGIGHTKLKQLRSIENYEPQLIDDIDKGKISTAQAYEKVRSKFLQKKQPKSKDKFPSKGNGKGKYKASIVPESQGMTISKDNRDGTFILIKDIVLKTKAGKYVSGDHPTAIHQNVSRSKGYNPDKVRKFEGIIERGEFKHGDDIPPVVVKLRNGKYRLVSGHHRFESHYNAGCAYMFVIIAEFNKFENFSAEYWLYTWQDIENKEDKNKVDKEVRTESDIISNILHCCRQGHVDVTNEEEIKTVLVHRGISRNSSRFLPMLRTIQRESGKYKGIPRVYTDAEKHLEDNGLEIDVNVLTPVMMESKSGKDSDRDPRWIRRVLNTSKILDKGKKIISYFHWDGLLTKEIIKVREVKDSEIMIHEVDKALDLISFVEDGGLRRIDIRYLPQIEGDDEDYVSADPEAWEKQCQEIEDKIKTWKKKLGEK